MAAEDSLFEAPGPVRTILQQFDIVIGFQDQDIGVADAFEGQFGGVAEVSKEANVAFSRFEQEPNRVLGIVRNAERFDRQIFQFEGSAACEKPEIKFRAELIFDGFLCRPIAIDGDPELFAQLNETLHVVGMFMGNEYARELFRGARDSGQAFANLSKAQTGINEEARV